MRLLFIAIQTFSLDYLTANITWLKWRRAADGARRSDYRLDQWKSGKLCPGGRAQPISRAIAISFDVALSLLNLLVNLLMWWLLYCDCSKLNQINSESNSQIRGNDVIELTRGIFWLWYSGIVLLWGLQKLTEMKVTCTFNHFLELRVY